MDSVIVTTALVGSVVVLDFGFCLSGHDKPQEGSIVTSASPRMGLVVIQTKEIDRWLLDARQCSSGTLGAGMLADLGLVQIKIRDTTSTSSSREGVCTLEPLVDLQLYSSTL